jgi:cytochrome c-type biogenesis protein
MGLASVRLGFVAGVLSVLPPCVFPLVPLVFGAAMAAYRCGTPPLLVIGSLSREAMGPWRGRVFRTGTAGKMLLGCLTLAIAVLVLSGADQAMEAELVSLSSDWLTDATTLILNV